MGDDYEIRTYYCHCGDIVPQDRQSYRYCEGRVWFTVSEIGDCIGYDDDVVSNAIAEIMPHLSSDKTYEREFKSTLKHISPDYRIKCYDVNVMKAVMHKLHERDVEFLLWAQSISGEDPLHRYEDYIKNKEKPMAQQLKPYRFNIFDRIWYEYEWASASYRHTRVNGLILYLVLFFTLAICMYSLNWPFWIIICSFFCFLFAYNWYFSDERCDAIKHHYGINREPMNAYIIVFYHLIAYGILFISMGVYLNKTHPDF